MLPQSKHNFALLKEFNFENIKKKKNKQDISITPPENNEKGLFICCGEELNQISDVDYFCNKCFQTRTKNEPQYVNNDILAYSFKKKIKNGNELQYRAKKYERTIDYLKKRNYICNFFNIAILYDISKLYHELLEDKNQLEKIDSKYTVLNVKKITRKLLMIICTEKICKDKNIILPSSKFIYNFYQVKEKNDREVKKKSSVVIKEEKEEEEEDKNPTQDYEEIVKTNLLKMFSRDEIMTKNDEINKNTKLVISVITNLENTNEYYDFSTYTIIIGVIYFLFGCKQNYKLLSTVYNLRESTLDKILTFLSANKEKLIK